MKDLKIYLIVAAGLLVIYIAVQFNRPKPTIITINITMLLPNALKK